MRYGKTNTTRNQIEEYLSGKEQKIPKSDFPDKIKSRQGVKDVQNKSSSKYAGVSKNKGKRKTTWTSIIHYKYESYYLGIFETETEAAMAYNEAALDLFGWRATLNSIPQKEICLLWK